jgi:hypothetical protein
MTNEVQVSSFLQEMTFFGDMNLAPYTIIPTQGLDGRFFMFFGTIPHEVVLYNSTPTISFVPTTAQISTLSEEDAELTLTPKDANNNVMNPLTNSSRRRRRPTKKAAPAMTIKVAHNSQISKKRALDEYQNQLMAKSAIPVSNPFTTLRIVAKNSTTGKLRQA